MRDNDLYITLMKYYSFFILIMLATGSIKAQQITTTEKVELKQQQLIEKGIKNIVRYTRNCVGSNTEVEDADSCFVNDIQYVIWSPVKNKTYIEKFDECKTYEAKEMKLDLIGIILKKHQKIKTENIKYPEYIDTINGKKETFTVIRDHSCHHSFDMHTKKGNLKLDIDEFALLTQYADDHRNLNINYKRNQLSVSNKLYKVISAEIY